MSDVENPLSYGVRQVIEDSGKTIYRIGEDSKVSCRNLYRFVAGTRRLSQESFDEIGKILKLTIVMKVRGQLTYYHPISDEKGATYPVGTPLSDYLRRAVKVSKKGIKEISKALGITQTHLYRFIAGAPDKSPGLSQAKLDKLCVLLGLRVKGPSISLPPRVKGAMRRTVERVYDPKPAPKAPIGLEKDQRPTLPSRPPSIFPPPEDDSFDET
jgi:hypothetical protein